MADNRYYIIASLRGVYAIPYLNLIADNKNKANTNEAFRKLMEFHQGEENHVMTDTLELPFLDDLEGHRVHFEGGFTMVYHHRRGYVYLYRTIYGDK